MPFYPGQEKLLFMPGRAAVKESPAGVLRNLFQGFYFPFLKQQLLPLSFPRNQYKVFICIYECIFINIYIYLHILHIHLCIYICDYVTIFIPAFICTYIYITMYLVSLIGAVIG